MYKKFLLVYLLFFIANISNTSSSMSNQQSIL